MKNKRKVDLIKQVNACFQRNDLRCIYKKEIDTNFTYRLGAAFVNFLKCKKVLVGHDMRLSSPALCDSLVKGIRNSGAEVIHLGLIDTPALYFATGKYNLPGIMITASHNPANYNGFKLVKAGAIPIGENTGLEKIKKLICYKDVCENKKAGKLIKKDIISDYKKFLHFFIKTKALTKLKIVVDAGNGMAGKMVPLIYKGLKSKILSLYFKLDGSFPNHVPNPVILKNLEKLQSKVKKEKADFGIAFDGDMDRVVFVDDLGRVLNSSITASLIIKHLLKKQKGNIIYSLVMSKLIQDTINEFRCNGFREKVGHSYMKARMREKKAIFGCEHSGHFYYKKNYYADSGVITSLIFLEIASNLKKEGKKLSEEIEELLGRYCKTEEKNFEVKNKLMVLKKVEENYKKRSDFMKKDYLDGMTMEFKNWWFNLRPSGTENLLRLNFEAYSKETLNKEYKTLTNYLNSVCRFH